MPCAACCPCSLLPRSDTCSAGVLVAVVLVADMLGGCSCRLLSRSDIFKPLFKEDYEEFLEKERVRLQQQRWQQLEPQHAISRSSSRQLE